MSLGSQVVFWSLAGSRVIWSAAHAAGGWLFSQREGQILVAALIFAVYGAICYLLSRRNAAWILWCIPLGLILSATYLNGMQASGGVAYGGISGDASFEIAAVNNVIHGNYLGDAYARGLPTDYSLLYFWILGTVARIIGLDALAAWRLAPAVLLLGAPFLIYRIGSDLRDSETGFWCCVAFFGLAAFHTEWFISPDRRWGTYASLIAKPHELLATLLLLYWCIRLARLSAGNALSRASMIGSGVVGALLVLTYYPLFVLGLAVLSAYAIFERDTAVRRNFLIYAASFGLLGLALSSLGWLPFLSALLTKAHEPSYRAYYLALWHFDPTLYTFGLGYFGAVFVLGAWALKDFGVDRAIKLLLILVACCYAVVLATFILYPLAGLSFLPQKWSEILLPLMAVLAGRGLRSLRDRLPNPPRPLLVYLALLVLIPSPLTWNVFTDPELGPAASDRDLVAAARALVASMQPASGQTALTVLATPPIAYAIPAVSTWQLYLAPNIHYSDPLAQYKLHAGQAMQLGRIATPDDMDRALRSMGVQVLVMGKGGEALLIEVDGDARPQSLLSPDASPYQVEVVRIRPRLFDAPYFTKVYEDQQYVAFVDVAAMQGLTATDCCNRLVTSQP